MRHRSVVAPVIVVLALALAVPVRAETQAPGPDQTFKVVLKDGSELIGRVVSQDATSMRFRTLAGVEMVIAKDKIASVEQVEVAKGQVVRPDPNRTRLFVAPTARPLRAGEGYFSVYEVLLPYFAIGLTDFLAVGGGMSLIPGSDGQLFYIAPKITPVRAKNFDLAGGVLYGGATSSSDHVGIVYGVGTYGTRRAALSLGLGWGFSGEGFSNKPILMIGGEIQVSSSVKIISENWIPSGEETKFLSFGIRLFGRRVAADFALIYPTGIETEGWPLIPFVGFTYNFGGKQR